jgi:hypothetical protein
MTDIHIHAIVWAGGLLLLSLSAQAQPADSLRSDSLSAPRGLPDLVDWQEADGARRAAEMLSGLTVRPLDPNRASAPELSTLPALTPALARRIVAYRDPHGPFSSLRALTSIEGITSDRLRALRPYLRLRGTASTATANGGRSVFPSGAELDGRLLQRVTRTLDPGRGFESDSTHHTFPGSPSGLTTRLRLHYGWLRAGLTLDQDPGEALRWAPGTRTYGVDHVAGHLAVEDAGLLETLILGDYTAEYGQGLALWQGLSFGKGQDPSALVRDGRGLIPFQSTTENAFFRGLATTLSLSSALSASAFVSRRTRDATLDTTTRSARDRTVVRTLSTGGLHRTPGQRRRRDALRMSTLGGALEYRTAAVVVGLAGYHSSFDNPLRPTDRPYRRFDLTGRRATKGSLFGHLFLDDYTFFGEVARTADGHYGALAGASFRGDRGVSALLMGRWYPPSFWSLHNGAVGEAGDPQNEVGVYAGLALPVTEEWRLRAYVDQYRFPWLRFAVPRPSWGLDTRLVSEYTPRPWFSTSLQLRSEREVAGADRRGPGGRRLAGLRPSSRQSARLQAEYTFADGVTLRTRLQGSRRTRADEPRMGVLVAQGLRLRPIDSVQLDARLAFFDTDGYPARIYAYERDLLYSFSVPVLYGQGQRSYVLVQYEPIPSLTIEAKYGVSWYPHRRTIGSGLTATEGPRVREGRLQIRWRL